MTKKIVIVDDEPKILEVVELYLKKSGYNTFVAYDGKSAIELFEKISPDMIILDLMLPEYSGEEICSYIRKKSKIPIIMLTAKTREDNKIAGLKLGADDYITKPFSPRELVARVETIFRRCTNEFSVCDIMSWNNNDLEADFLAVTIKKRDKLINITPNEFKIFKTLAKNNNIVFTREKLIEAAFGLEFDGFDRTIDSHIKNLRAKIENNSVNPIYILTVRGIGYKFGGNVD